MAGTPITKNKLTREKTEVYSHVYLIIIYMGDPQGKMSNSKQWLRTPAYTASPVKNNEFVKNSFGRPNERSFRLSRAANCGKINMYTKGNEWNTKASC